MRIRIVILLAVVAVASAGCSRKPPKHFKADKPAIEIPIAGLGDKLQTGELEAMKQQDTFAPGKWRMRLDRTVSMRSTTMATTEISTIVELTLNSDAPVAETDGFGTPFHVTSIGAAVTAQQNVEEVKQSVEDTFEHLSFDIRTGFSGMSSASSIDNKKIPGELTRAVMMMIPSPPDASELSKGPRDVSVKLNVPLPGEAVAVEELKGNWRMSGVSNGIAVMVFDYTTKISGSTMFGGIAGKITQGDGRGRVVCRISTTGKGLQTSEWFESTVFSVQLKGDKRSTKTLEQKVTSKALLTQLKDTDVPAQTDEED